MVALRLSREKATRFRRVSGGGGQTLVSADCAVEEQGCGCRGLSWVEFKRE